MTTTRLPSVSPRRLELLAHIGDVSVWPDGTTDRFAYGRRWKVGGDVKWLLAAELIEPDPDRDGLGHFRRTALGDAVVAADNDKKVTR